MHNELTKTLIVLATIASCNERSKQEKAPEPTANKAAPVETSAAPGSGSAGGPTGSASGPTGSAGGPTGSANAGPPAAAAEAQAFCEKLMHKMLACFDDAGFWDVFATTYFAKYPDATGNPDAKKTWIGMLKDDFVGLKGEGKLAENCGVMVRGLRLPTAADMQPVNAAMAKSCTDFGTSMGLLLFHKGVFHMPR